LECRSVQGGCKWVIFAEAGYYQPVGYTVMIEREHIAEQSSGSFTAFLRRFWSFVRKIFFPKKELLQVVSVEF